MAKRCAGKRKTNAFGDKELKVRHPYAIKAVREYEALVRGFDRAIDRIEAKWIRELKKTEK